MKTIYEILGEKSKDGQWLNKYEVADDFPIIYGYTNVAPDHSLKFPKWDERTATWAEDKDQLIISLNQQILDGQAQINQLQSDLLDMMELVSTLGGEASV